MNTPDIGLCEQHTNDLKNLDKKFDIQEVKISKMYVALCGGLNENGEHVEGQLARWKSAHRFLKVLTGLMSAVVLGVIGAAFKCAPTVMKAASIVENSQ